MCRIRYEPDLSSGSAEKCRHGPRKDSFPPGVGRRGRVRRISPFLAISSNFDKPKCCDHLEDPLRAPAASPGTTGGPPGVPRSRPGNSHQSGVNLPSATPSYLGRVVRVNNQPAHGKTRPNARARHPRKSASFCHFCDGGCAVYRHSWPFHRILINQSAVII